MRIPILSKLLFGACLLPLAACGGGGGGTAMTAASTSGGTTTSGGTSTGPQFTIALPAFSGTSGVPLPVASAATKSFTTAAPIGVTFPLDQAVLTVTAASVVGDAQQASITLTGFDSTTHYGLFELKIPTLNLDVSNLSSDYTAVTLTNGTRVRMYVGGGLQYMFFAEWGVIPPTSGGTGHFGYGTTGYATPLSGMPATGTATYASGTVGTLGDTFYVDSTGAGVSASLKGQANLTANFSNGTITGALTNMMVLPSDGSATTPWNNVTLSGSIVGTGVNGTTASSAPAATTVYTLGASAGHFYGNFYGPGANEVGAVWTLTDSTTPNKGAIGVLGATKQ